MSSPTVETAAVPAAPAPAPAPPAPLASRIVDVFFSPAKAFEQLREGKAPWLGPVLVCIALALLVIAVRPLFISDQKMAEAGLEQMRQMGVQQLPSVDELAAKMTQQTILGAVGATVWMFLRVGLVGLILFGVYGLALGGRNDLRPYMAVTSHAFLVPTVGFLLVAALQYATGRLDITMDAALLAPGLDSGGVLARVLHGITPWGVWLVALLALGGATINRRKGWIGVAVLLFALQMAMVTGFAMLTHLAAGRAAAAG
ncbi:MAG TPA: YIP1 family protein [Longimicrobiaceae bacterium]|nr:YIP1 family protein [Longimicrobiaceae bacterium]